jgi:hypothetical protein
MDDLRKLPSRWVDEVADNATGLLQDLYGIPYDRRSRTGCSATEELVWRQSMSIWRQDWEFDNRQCAYLDVLFLSVTTHNMSMISNESILYSKAIMHQTPRAPRRLEGYQK